MSSETVATTAPFTELSARRLGPVRRWFVRHPVAMDVLLVLGFAAWALLMGVGADSMYSLSAYLGDQAARAQYASLALTAVGAVVLFWRRRRPVVVAAATAALGVVALAATGATSGFEVGLALALYAVATAERPVVTWVTTGVTVLALLVAARVLPLPATVGAIMLGVDPADVTEFEAVTRHARTGGFIQSSVWFQTAVPVLCLALLAVAVGTSVRNRRQHLASFVEAANALARDQDQRARLAQAAERARIAREMHDVVAHSISVMVALGGGAAAAVDWAPERSRVALDELVATGRSALGDMRRVLGVLHDDEPGSGSAQGAEMEPQPGSLDLAGLVDGFRTAGLPVQTTGLADEGLHDLEPTLQLAVFRIVQESLTNVLRHAPGTPAVRVGVHRQAGHVEVVVTDEGPAVPRGTDDRVGGGHETAQGSQRGLVGMRERATVFGGTVEAGPYGGGWRVRALLPWREGDA